MRREESAHALGRLGVAGDINPQIVRAVDAALRINKEHESCIRHVAVDAAKALAVVGPTAREVLDHSASLFACDLASTLKRNNAVLDTSRHTIVEDLAGFMRHKVATLVIRSRRVPIRTTNHRGQLAIDVQATIKNNMERHATGNLPPW